MVKLVSTSFQISSEADGFASLVDTAAISISHNVEGKPQFHGHQEQQAVPHMICGFLIPGNKLSLPDYVMVRRVLL
jgi:hypothetical protein